MICNTPTIPSMPIIHALQVLATYMPQYHKSILPRVKMGIFVRNKFSSPSEFKCDSNALIFSSNGRILSEIHEIQHLPNKKGNFEVTPYVPDPQIAVNLLKSSNKCHQVLASRVFPLNYTHLYLIGNKYDKYQLRIFLIFLIC